MTHPTPNDHGLDAPLRGMHGDGWDRLLRALHSTVEPA